MNTEMSPERFKKLLRPATQYICVKISYRRRDGGSAQKSLIEDLTFHIKSLLHDTDLSAVEPSTLKGIWLMTEGKSEDKQKMINLKFQRKFQEHSLGSTSRVVQLGLWKDTYMVLPADDSGHWVPTLGQIKKAWDLVKK